MIFDENLNLIRMVFNKGEGFPEHDSNSNVYMSVIRRTLSIALGEQEYHVYAAGTVLKIPIDTENECENLHDETLKLIIVKASAPGK